MSIFTFHLVKTSYTAALKAIFFPPKPINTPGLIHAECMTCMTLGSPVFSPSRMLVRQVAVFAQWENESAIDNFLEENAFGKILATGWHTRLIYLRQWGKISEFVIPTESNAVDDPEAPVVAVTLARMKLFQVPRFIHWGRPVEKLVRDHPGTTLALASIRLARTVSTFSIWKSQREMVKMVHGHSTVPQPKRHADAMKERDRKDFHIQFTTLRFKPIAEYGEWRVVPTLFLTLLQLHEHSVSHAKVSRLVYATVGNFMGQTDRAKSCSVVDRPFWKLRNHCGYFYKSISER